MKQLISSLVLTLAGLTASAATVVLPGVNFDIQYDSALSGLFGNAQIANNIIYFTPTSFTAQSLNGAGMVTTASNVNFKIIPKNGYVVGSVALQERGDYILRGANSYITVGGQTQVFSDFDPSNIFSASINSTSDLSVRNGLQNNWSAMSLMSLGGLNLGANEAFNYSIDSILGAYTDPNDRGPKRAFIENKFSGFAVQVSPVPEPSTVLTLFAGLGAIAFAIARKGKQP
jgi:PEP-CTERM motif